MRALMVVFALAVASFATAVSQGQSLTGNQAVLKDSKGKGHDAAHCAKRFAKHADKDMKKCPADPLPPPPPQLPPPTSSGGCVSSGPGTGSGTIGGQVFKDQDPWPFLGGWCVQLLDASGAVVAMAVTSDTSLDSDNDNFTFKGVAAGTYTVCEIVANTWSLDYPSASYACGSGGYSVPVTDGSGAGFIWFGNLP